MTRLVILCCCVLWALAGCSRPEPLPTYNSVPDFALTSERGETVTLDDLQTQVWVADFIFTQCMGPCPLMSAHMAKLQRALDDEGLDVKLVSVSVDPETDTPEVLAEYAARFGADPARWTFLTGGKQEIYDMIFHGFQLAVDDGSLAAGGKPGPGIITHSVKFVLIDGEGRIRGYYSGEEAGVVDALLPDIRRLLAPG